MSALAKVFVVIVLILAVAFTGTTATLYTARQDWKEAARNSLAEYQKNADEWLKQKADLAGVIKQNTNNISDLTVKNTTLQTSTDAMNRDVERLNSDLAVVKKDLKTSLDRNQEKDGHLKQKDDENSRLSKLGDELRTRTEKAEESEKAALVHASRKDLDNEQLSKQLADTQIELAGLKKGYDDFASAFGRLKEGFPEVAERILIAKPAPPIDGVVLAVHADTDIVVLSVGRDEKVETGFDFVAYRGDRYLGKVQVTKVAADMCGARILYLEEGQKIQTGDLVTTKIGQ